MSTKIPLLALFITFLPFGSLQYIKVMDNQPLGAFLGEWSYANGFDTAAGFFNHFACSKGEASACSLLAEIRALEGNVFEASELTHKACQLGFKSACPDFIY